MSIPIKKIILLLLIPIGAPTGCNGQTINKNNGTSNEKNTNLSKIKEISSLKNNSSKIAKHTTKTGSLNTVNKKLDLPIEEISNDDDNNEENIDNMDTDSEYDYDNENDDQFTKKTKKERIKIWNNWNKLKKFFKKKENGCED